MSKNKRVLNDGKNEGYNETNSAGLGNIQRRETSGEFYGLSKRFLLYKEKDLNAQLLGTTFSYLLIIFGLLLLYLCFILFEIEIPQSLVVQMIVVIALQIAIGVMERVRLRKVARWYKLSKGGDEMLSKIQVSMLENLSSMIRLSLLNLLLSFIFIIIQTLNHSLVVSSIELLNIPVYLPNYSYAMKLYNFLILLSRMIVFLYLVYLVWRLTIWVKRNKEFIRFETRMQKEIPDLKELADLEETQDN